MFTDRIICLELGTMEYIDLLNDGPTASYYSRFNFHTLMRGWGGLENYW